MPNSSTRFFFEKRVRGADHGCLVGMIASTSVTFVDSLQETLVPRLRCPSGRGSQHAQGSRGAEIPMKIGWNLMPTKARSPSTFPGVLNVLQISGSKTMRTCVLNPAGPSSNSEDWEIIFLSFLLQSHSQG